MNKDQINISEAVQNAIGHRVRLETVEGIVRTGKLTGVRWRFIQHGSNTKGLRVSLEQPLELILDHDDADPLPWINLVAFECTGATA